MEIAHGSSDALLRNKVHAGPLWFAVLCGPLAALANEQIEYLMVTWSCGRFDAASRILLHLVPLALIALCVISALIAWRARTEPLDASDEHQTDADRSRRGFMALLGMGLSVGGALVVLAMWSPVWYLNPCTFL